MASQPTLNPVPSENYDDMRFNAGKLDEFVTSDADEYTDRLGVTHLTARGLQNSVAGALLPANNLSDVSDKNVALSNLGGQSTGIAVFKAATPLLARSAIASAASGSNADITELTGLTTALSITQGGTGGKTANAARTNLGIGTLGTQNASSVSITGGSIAGINDLAIADGGTGASSAATARANLGAKADAGITDASSASAGQVGEVSTAITAVGTPVTLTSGTPANAISLTLPPGDWELNGMARFDPTAAAITQASGSWNTASSTFAGFPDNTQIQGLTGGGITQIPLPHRRYNISTTTTIYLVVLSVFGSGSCTARGYIEARRTR